MSAEGKKLGILVGGGPAPGINSVISAATIRARLEGVDVVGIGNGFQRLMRGDTTFTRELTIAGVSRLHFRGGSVIGTARDNPTKDPALLDATIRSLEALGIDKLVSIGGDDTAYSAMTVEKAAAGRIRVAHVPKTIDNDLDLPHGIPTFGFQTARHVGVQLVRNLMVDAQTTGRWYFVVSMGRQAGHLALGIGKATGATLSVIPEEFPDETISLDHVADVLVGSIIKRAAYGREDGVAVIAEGVTERIDADDLSGLSDVERDAHGHIRLSEVNLSEILRQRVLEKLRGFGISITINVHNVGYELRCADPIPFDLEYTRDLGFCAAQFLLEGGSSAMMSIQEGRFVPIPFAEILDSRTGRARVRSVDVAAESYYIARRYMLRLNRSDFESEEELARLGAACGLSGDAFRERFGYLMDRDALYHALDQSALRLSGREGNEGFRRG